MSSRTLTCAKCAQEFTVTDRGRYKYCSDACVRSARRERERTVRVCRECGVEVADRKRFCSKRCRKDFNAARRPQCGVDGCSDTVINKSRGMCFKHDRRMRLYGDPLGGGEFHAPGAACSADGCDATSVARALCSKHYNRLMARPDGSIADPLTRCGACLHPERRSLDRSVLSGERYEVLAPRFGLLSTTICQHARNHLGVVRRGNVARCVVCDHPLIEEITAALDAGERRVDVADRFGLNPVTLWRHMKPEHQEKRAVSAIRQLNIALAYVNDLSR